MSNVIRVENVSKQYRLGQIGTGTISHDINRWLHKLRGNEDPYLKIGDENDRTKKGDSEYVWALQGINFEIGQGDIMGVIGNNGAGKSTLLKILSRTTAPTIGQVKIKGKVASLLEVGTGFHPDLSGRDNVYLNGAILGMTTKEIKTKFDEIVDFSGVEKYIDTPVKRYSSGMYVRLAFAVAAHLEPDILIVDEVLAVGDAEFQKKALGKMKDVGNQQGRTVLFVSHNMAAIKALCTKSIVMANGKFVYGGGVETGVKEYMLRNSLASSNSKNEVDNNKPFSFTAIKFFNNSNEDIIAVSSMDSICCRIYYQASQSIDKEKLILSLAFIDEMQNQVAFFVSDEQGFKIDSTDDRGYIELFIPQLMLRGGDYNIRLFAGYETTVNVVDIVETAGTIKIFATDFWGTGKIIRESRSALFNGIFQ